MDQTCGSQTAGVYTCGVSGQEVEAIIVATNGGIPQGSLTLSAKPRLTISKQDTESGTT